MNFSTPPHYNESNLLPKNFVSNLPAEAESFTAPGSLETEAFASPLAEAWAPMAAFLDTMQEAVSGVDEYLCVKYWNKAMSRLSGVAIEEAMHRPLFSLLPRDFEHNLAARLGRLFKQRANEKTAAAEIVEGEFSQRHGNSEFFDFSYRMRVLPTNAQRELAIITLCPVREGRQPRRKEQPESFGLLGQLSAGIAQELAGPLNTICSRIDNIVALAGDHWNAPLEEELHSIITEVYRLSQLINSILTLSSHDAAGAVQVNLNQLIPETLVLLEHTLNRQIACVTALPEDLPPVQGDPVLLQSVLQNILRYAVEAAGEDAVPRIQVGLHVHAPANGRNKTAPPAQYAIIRIEDRGALLTPAELAQLFDPIPSSRRFGIAVGLGLFLSKKIIESHGGQIQVAGERGRGTIFTIALKA